MKLRKFASVFLSAAMVLNMASPAFGAEGNGETGSTIPDPILEFDFGTEQVTRADDGTGETTVKGKALINGEEQAITAETTNIEFATDELGNDIAVFSLGTDGKVPNIKYSASTLQKGETDPFELLEKNKGATVSAWVKTVGGDFQNTIFYYGEDSASMHSSLQVVAQNDTKNNDEKGNRAFYYRGDTGSTKIKDENGKELTEQKPPKGSAVYLDDVWQLVTYVEDADGSGTLYVDGVVNAKWENKVGDKARSLYDFVHDDDNNADAIADALYIGATPGLAQDYFIGGMDSFSVYNQPLTQEQIKEISEDYKATKLPEAIKVFEATRAKAQEVYDKHNDNDRKYSNTSWTIFKSALEKANAFNGTTLDDYTIAYKELKRAQSGLVRSTATNEPVVEFNFSNVKQRNSKEEGQKMEVVGITDGGAEVTATATGINFRDGIAIFPKTAATVGIEYHPTTADDPMTKLGNTDGTTIAIWLKTSESEFTSSLFAYGAMREKDGTKLNALGRSIHIMGRNGLKSDTGTVFYRGNDGTTEIYDGNTKIGNQKITQGRGKERPYSVSSWQLLTYVENIDGTGVLYLDDQEIGKYDVEKAKTKLYDYAHDEYTPDNYYIGFLPYEDEDGDTHFVGELDNVAVYKKAMSQTEVDNLYEIKMLEDAIKAAEKLQDGNYVDGSQWDAFQKALEEAKKIDLDTATTSDIEKARNNLEQTKGQLIENNATESLWEKARKDLRDAVERAKDIADKYNVDLGQLEAAAANTNAIEEYTADTWNDFLVAYETAAEDLKVADGDDGQSKITADKMNRDYKALDDLLDAMGDPDVRNARVNLEKLISYVEENYKRSDDEYDENVVYYTSDTWADLMTALDKARAEVDNVNASAESLEAAYNQLDAAKGALEKTPVQLWKEARAALKVEIEAWKTTYEEDKDKYSGATWNAFAAAYEGASDYLANLKEPTEDPEGETTEMGSLKEKLNTAGNALDEKSDAEKDADIAWATLEETLKKWEDVYGEGTNTVYTDDSWKAFVDAYEAADGIITAGRAALDKTAEELNKINAALENAGNALKTKDEAFKDAWDALKISYDANTENYNKTSKAYKSGWKEFEEAYKAAGTALAAPSPYDPNVVTTEKLIELKTKLDAASDGLVAKTEDELGKEALDEAWTKLAGALETYKPRHELGADAYKAGWEDFDKAYTEADKTINMNPYEPATLTVAGLTKLYDNLEAAANKLVAKTSAELDKEALEKAWSDLAGAVDALKEKHDKGADAYTAGWEAFDVAYTAADKVINGTPYEPASLTVEGLKELYNNLMEAEKGLKEKTQDELNQEALEKAWATLAGTLEDLKDEHDAGEAAYASGWQDFDAAYKVADKVINDVNPYEPSTPTVALLNGYNEALLHAAANLVKKTEDEIAKEELDKVIEEAEKIIEEGQKDYTDESWKNLEDAVENAKNPPEDAKAEDYEELQNQLQDAIDNRQTNEEAAREEAKKNLDAAVEEAKPIIEAGQGDYTDDSWKAFVDAYEKAKNPPADATADELKQLQEALEAAKAGLQTWEQAALAEAKKNLEIAVETARPIKEAGQGNNTDESWKAFTDAYNAASAPPETATVEDLAKLKTDLETAQKALTTNTVTAEEQQIMDLLGVTADEARQILQIMAEYNIPLDTVAITEQMILNMKNDNDIKGSTFGLLQLRSVKETDKTVKVKWKKVKGADGYLVYGNKCGKSYKLLKSLGANKKNYTQKKLKKGTYYKYLVVAYKNVGGVKVTLAASKTIHTVTKGGKCGVAKSVTVEPKKVNLKVKKTKKVKATEVKKDKPIKPHRKVSFESDKPEIATVNKKGKIKALKKGTCTIYAYAQNGVFKKIKVKVK